MLRSSLRDAGAPVLAAAACLLAAAPVSAPLAAQGAPAASPGDTARAEVLRVYLDCESFGCDRDFFVTEIQFANWVRDRRDADVHVLVTSLDMGGGGEQHTVTFVGQRRFAGWGDTLVVTTLPNAADDAARRVLARAFKAGLVRYALRTPAGARLVVGYEAPDGQGAVTTRVRDPWNFWTFTPSVNAFLNGESQQTFANVNADLSAARTTEAWKFRAGVGGSFNRSRFTLDDGEGGERTSTFVQRSLWSDARLVRSIGGTWAAGLSASAGYSDFRNHQLAARVGPTVEWNLFPWTEATRRQLTFAYTLRGHHFEYQRETIFGRRSETRASHLAVVALDTRQRWGTAEWSASASQYLHDPARNNLSTGVELELRLVRGLSLELDGGVSRVRDQLFLSSAGLSRDEVLLRQRALATSYEFYTWVGLNYTFGSIYNTVVNPRLDAIERAQ